jgi:hypothetical protein
MKRDALVEMPVSGSWRLARGGQSGTLAVESVKNDLRAWAK